MSDKRNPSTGGIPELRDACARFDEALRAFVRNSLASRDIAYDVARLLFQIRELERKLNG